MSVRDLEHLLMHNLERIDPLLKFDVIRRHFGLDFIVSAIKPNVSLI
jgi:hypothetical protein